MTAPATKVVSNSSPQIDPSLLLRGTKKKTAGSGDTPFSALLEKIRSALTGAGDAKPLSAAVGASSQTQQDKLGLPTGTREASLVVRDLPVTADATRRRIGARETPTADRGANRGVPGLGSSARVADARDADASLKIKETRFNEARFNEARFNEARADEAKVTEANKSAIEGRRTRRSAADDREGSMVSSDAASSVAAAMAASMNAGGKTQQARLSSMVGAGGAESEGEGARTVDGRRKDKRKERFEIEVHDLRRNEGVGALKGATEAFGADKNAQVSPSSQSGADIVVALRGDHAETGDRSFEAAARGQTTTSFSDALARELREVYNADIVQRAAVTLKDGGEGLIRLSLKPESLGAVKIKLELADNKIAGRILVETDEALQAFSKELRSLEQAFLDGGFDGASLELALSSGDSGHGSNNGRGEDSGRPFFSDRLLVSEYDTAVPRADNSGRTDAVIDMLV